MPVNMISEEELRAALKPYRVDPEKFEAAVRERANEGAGREYDPLATMSPLLRTAASFLPLEVLTAGQVAGPAVKSAPAAGAPVVGVFSKLLGYLALPAISMFVLLGATIFGALRIRRIQSENRPRQLDEEAMLASTTRWSRDHRWGRWLLYATTLALAWFGETWSMFLGYIVSTLVLLYILKSFARVGIGNQLVVGQSAMSGLLLLGQVAGFAGIGDEAIHLVDHALLVPLFFVGALVIALVLARDRTFPFRAPGIFAVIALLGVAAWFMNPILWPATPARIRAYVESFDRAEFSSASWRPWEIAASWAVKRTPAPDLSRPRRLLAEEIAGEQDPLVLGSAFHVGLVQVDQVSQLKDYESKLGALLDNSSPGIQIISPLDFNGWVIRAAILRNDLTPGQRDYLAERLHATLRWWLERAPGRLRNPLLATQLLAAIGRPVDPTLYQADIHALLLRLHSKTGGGFRRAGGFRAFDVENLRVGDLDATSDAIELMGVYGIPKDLDMNWVRSFLRPSVVELSPEKWMAAVTLDRLNQLPGVTRPSWAEILYYERSFLAAVILIGLCIYATVISPKPLIAPPQR